MDQYDPNTVSMEPRYSGDRPRMQLYLWIIAGDIPLDQGLGSESERLNQMLDIAATGYSFRREEYIYPQFDPRSPLLGRASRAVQAADANRIGLYSGTFPGQYG